jgi:hypothetical protein
MITTRLVKVGCNLSGLRGKVCSEPLRQRLRRVEGVICHCTSDRLQRI